MKINLKTILFLLLSFSLTGCSVYPWNNTCDYIIPAINPAFNGSVTVSQQAFDDSRELEMDLLFLEYEVDSDDEITARTIELASNILELDPYNYRAYIERSVAYSKLGEAEKSYGDLRTVTLLYPGTHRFFFELVPLPSEDDFSEIKRSLSRCLKANPDHPDYLFEMGVYHFIIGELEESSEYFEKTILLDSRSYLSHFLSASIHYEREELDMAYAHINKAIELQDETPFFYELKAELAGALGYDEDEKSSYESMLETCNHHDVCFKAFFQTNK